jgi:hypothetical protein
VPCAQRQSGFVGRPASTPMCPAQPHCHPAFVGKRGRKGVRQPLVSGLMSQDGIKKYGQKDGNRHTDDTECTRVYTARPNPLKP